MTCSWVRRSALAAFTIIAVGCHGPVRIPYTERVDLPARPGQDAYQEIPLRRFALSPKGTLPRQLWERLTQAAELANRFIDSDVNRYFPAGYHFRATQDGRLFLDSDGGDGFRVRIHVTCWGTLVAELGFSAQERADGFSVGMMRDAGGAPVDATIANSLWFNLDGSWRDASDMAALLLHEMSHALQVRAQGQTSYWLEYYLRATILLQGGGRIHELEKVPYRVTTEFRRWWSERNEPDTF